MNPIFLAGFLLFMISSVFACFSLIKYRKRLIYTDTIYNIAGVIAFVLMIYAFVTESRKRIRDKDFGLCKALLIISGIVYFILNATLVFHIFYGYSYAKKFMPNILLDRRAAKELVVNDPKTANTLIANMQNGKTIQTKMENVAANNIEKATKRKPKLPKPKQPAFMAALNKDPKKRKQTTMKKQPGGESFKELEARMDRERKARMKIDK